MIKNSDDANKYYSLVESHVSDYLAKYSKKFDVEPLKLAQHLLKNKSLLVEFLSKRGLSEVSGINRVVQDVLEDIVSFYKDNILTFENFNFSSNQRSNSSFKGCLFLGISEPTIEHEKLLADLFDCSLSHVECVNPQKRIFRVDSAELESVVVYTDSELDIIYENMLEYLVNEFINKDLSVEGVYLGSLGDIVDSESVSNKLKGVFSKEDCREKVCVLLSGKELSTETGLVIEL
jgi:hypothetical protein